MRPITPALAELFNRYGGGLIHMEIFRGRTPRGQRAVPGAVRRLLMGVRLASRWARGQVSAPTQVAAGNSTDFAAVDGLDLTLEIDDSFIHIDAIISASFSVNPGSLLIGVNVDNAVDQSQIIQASYAGTTVIQFSANFSLPVGPGTHRYRIFATAANACTITFTARDRAMRVSGLLGTA